MKKILFALVFSLFAAQAWAIELRPVKTHNMPFDATSRAVTDLLGFKGGYNVGPFTQYIRLVCTQSCFVAFSATDITPTLSATASTAMFLPSNVPEIFMARGNQRIGVIRLTTDGTLYITEMSK